MLEGRGIQVSSAVTLAQLGEVDQFDSNMLSWPEVNNFFDDIKDKPLPLNITSGQVGKTLFPWWVFLASDEKSERLKAAGDSVNQVWIVRNDSIPKNPFTFLIIRDDATVRLHKSKGKGLQVIDEAEYNRLMRPQ